MSVMQRLRAIRDRMAAQSEIEHSEDAAPPAPAPEAAAPVQAASFVPVAPAPAPADSVSASMWELVSPMDALEEEPAAAESDPFADPFADLPADLSAEPQPDPLTGRFDDLQEDIRPAPAPPHRLFGDRPLRAVPSPEAAPLAEPFAPVAAELPGAGLRRSGRVKTRLLGFEHSTGHTTDIFERPATTQPVRGAQFPVGWIVVVDGPGRGASMALLAGVSQIGRDEDQAIQLDFGDTAVSRKNHAAIAYDEETRSFFVGHGGKSNLVRLNGKPLLSTEPMRDGDTLTIGETRLRLVALCGEAFSWSDTGAAESAGT